MLVNRPSAFIFQQIILPYIVSARQPIQIHNQRYFSSSSSATRPLTTSEEHRTDSAYEPYPASLSGSGSVARRRTREYLDLEGNGGESSGSSSSSRSKKVEVDGELEAHKRTASLAIERIIQSHQPLASGSQDGSRSGVRVKTSEKGKGKALQEGGFSSRPDGPSRQNQKMRDLEEPPESPIRTNDQSMTSSTNALKTTTTSTTTTRTTPSIPETTPTEPKKPFPPLIFKLLQARQFRLAVLHILHVPLYALDQALIEDVAGFMERHNGGNAAARLRRGRTPTPEERRLMSDHESDIGKLPTNYWSLSKSLRPPPRILDDVSTFMPGIELSQSEKFTAFCNLQLAHLSTLNDQPTLGKRMIPPKSLKRPNTSLQQLRGLLDRIHRLETHRGFIPDRVTANIILSCWLRCSTTPPSIGKRINHTKSGWKVNSKHTPQSQIQSQSFGRDELNRMFELVSKLIDRSVVGRDESLSHTRHVKPFVRMLSKGFEDLGDHEGIVKVKEWHKSVKSVLLERHAGERAEVNNGEDKVE